MQNDIGELRVLITAQADKFNSEIAKVRGELAAMSKATSNISAKTFALGNILGKIATKAFGSLVGVVREARNVYDETSASMTKLATVMQQRGATQAQYNAVIKTTEAEERLGVVSAAVQQNGLQELATYVGKAESLQKLTNVMNNLIVQQHGYNATADHALQTATMMGKVLQGQTGGMERIGYHLDEADKALFQYGTEEERVALLTEIVNNNLGNMNRRLGETNTGKQIQLANTWAQLRAQVGELATAVGNILIPAFSAVANVVGRAIAYIKAFFKLFGVETGNAASATASSVSDASDAVSSYGDAASGAAKKVKKSLAAFDEMNTITEQSSSGSSGDGGGFDILGDLEASATQIDWGSLIPDLELPDWLKQLGNIFSDIDTERLKGAFLTLWDDIKTGAQPVMSVVDDLWNNYLKPLVNWVGNSYLPTWFKSLGDQVKFFGELVESLWSVALKPFIDAFLVPIAEFTGGIIVTVLETVGSALGSLAENKTGIDMLVVALTAVGSAIAVWKIDDIALFAANLTKFEPLQNIILNVGAAIEKANTNLSKFIKNGVSKITSTLKHPIASLKEFNSHLGDGIKTAWGKTKDAFSGLEAGFKNIVTHGGTTTNWIKGTALSAFDGFKNVLSSVKTGVTNLWNAFLANPLGAIIGLFSILMTTNEEFREKVTNLIRSALAPLADAFSKIMGLVEPILNIVVQLIELALEPLIAILDGLAPIITTLLDVALLPLKLAFEAIGKAIEVLKPVLEGISAVIEIVSNAINGLFGWLGNLLGITNDNTEATEDFTQGLSEQQQQFDKNGDGALDYAENLEYVRSVIAGTNDAEEDLIQANKNQLKAMQELGSYCAKYGKTAEELIAMHRRGELQTLDSGDALVELTSAVIDLEQANYKVESATDKFNTKQGELQSAANQTKERLDEAGQELLKLGEQGVTSGNKWNELTQRIKEYGSQIKETGKNVGEIRNWEDDAREAAFRVVEGAIQGVVLYQPQYDEALGDMADSGNQAVKNKAPEAFNSGANLSQGLVNGVYSKGNELWGAGAWAANTVIGAVNQTAVVHSPSKKTGKIGAFLSEGLVVGMNSKMGALKESAQKMVGTVLDNLAPLSDGAASDIFDASVSGILKTNGKIDLANADIELDQEPVHVTVKVGEDTLIDKIVTGINDLSRLGNNTVIAV